MDRNKAIEIVKFYTRGIISLDTIMEYCVFKGKTQEDLFILYAFINNNPSVVHSIAKGMIERIILDFNIILIHQDNKFVTAY